MQMGANTRFGKKRNRIVKLVGILFIIFVLLFSVVGVIVMYMST